MKKRGKQKKTVVNATSYFLTRGIYWLAIAILCPMLIAFYQTYQTGRDSVSQQSELVLQFLKGEAEKALGLAELSMDQYLLKTGGSCASDDLLSLKRLVATKDYILSMGIVATDGKIACSFGDKTFNNLTFPKHGGVANKNLDFAEWRGSEFSLPILVKTSDAGTRVYAVISEKFFYNALLPSFMAKYSQIDVILPNGGLWYSLAGQNIRDGFSDNTLYFDKVSERFPVSFSLVLDKRAINDWAGDLYQSLIIIIVLSLSCLVLCFLGYKFFLDFKKRRLIQKQIIAIENARLNFEVLYQPLINLDTQLLVGVVAHVDLSIFDKVPQAKPGLDKVLGVIWDEIGDFAEKRREFNLIVAVDGEDVVGGSKRGAIVDKLKEIDYDHLTLLLQWEGDRGVEQELYRPLEEIALAGANIAIDCTTIRFSLLSDMWAWPYHQLVIDYSNLPDSEEAANWISEIIMNMSEELHIEGTAIGLDNKAYRNYALSSGFKVGAGHYFSPYLGIDSFMEIVRPVKSKQQNSENQEAAA